MNQQLITRIEDLVSNGIKGVELATILATEFIQLEQIEIMGTIEELVEQGEIIEIQYVLPHMDYRIKSFYLPKGTKIEISK